jgi:hypothetical protein
VDTTFKFNKQYQKDNEQEIQIEKNGVTTFGRFKFFYGGKK